MFHTRTKIIFMILVALFVIRSYVNTVLGLAPDEAHYWYWSQNLQLSYFDHPPMVAYMIALSTWIGGNSEFFVRFAGFLIMGLSHVFIFLTARQLTDHPKEFAWEVLLALNASLLFTAGCIIQTPDTPLTLFWCIGLYTGSRIVTGGSPRWWYLWGLALGLGLLSKYTMILIVPCTVAFVILSPPHRYWLRRKEPYWAGLLAFILFLPVIYWNATHQWISFAMQLNQGFGPRDESAIKKLLEYIGGQVGVITPLLFVSFFYYSLYGLIKSLRKKNANPNHLYLGMLCWPILIFFGISSLRGEVAEPNWPALAYISGLILTSDIFHRHYRQSTFHRRYVYIALGAALTLNVVLMGHLTHPYLPLTEKQDNTKQFHGWRELGQTIQKEIDAHPNEAGYFLSAGYGITTVAPMVFYTGQQYLGLDFFRPEEYTFLGDKRPQPGQNAIILLNHYEPRLLESYQPYFNKVHSIGHTKYLFQGYPCKRLDLEIVLGEGYQGDWKPGIPERE